ncbi:hypothetical protein [Streptosporangium sp. NPDC051022]|uniref:hypothetical protein n=1 Tax=Streptosporangium sp. NPDC051022 TaxID=3155752 RepID=UPI00341778A8
MSVRQDRTRFSRAPPPAHRGAASGDRGRDLPDHSSLVRTIRRWESGATTMLSERYRLLYSRAMGIPEAILFAPAGTLSRYDGTADNDGRTSGDEGEGDPTNRRDVLRVGLAAAMGRVLGDAADEAMEFTRRASQTAVGRSTLEHLEVAITDIATNVNRSSPADVFSVARAYRQRVDQLIRSPHTLKEGRELFVYAGWLSQELAWLAHELGNPSAARAYAIDAFEHADQAGHDELYAHATNALASIAIQDKQPDRALSAARKGLARVPSRHILAVRLNTQAARANAQLKQRAECESLLHAAEEAYERLPGSLPGRFGTDAGASAAAQTIPSYSALAWLSLGDFDRSRRQSEIAIAAYEAKPAESRVPSSEALTRLYLGIALAQLGSPEEAIAMGTQGLESPRMTAPIRSRATHLDEILMKRYPGMSEAEDFHQRRLTLAT